MNKQIYQPLTPSFSTSFSTGWETMKDYFLRLFLLLLVLWLVSIPMGLIHIDHEYETTGAILLRIIGIGYFFLIYPVFDYCVSYLFVKGVRREEVDVKNVLKGFDYYLNIVLANLLLTALIGIAFLALIIPGIIVACRLAFVQYLVIDKQLGAIEAIEESWRMTRGYGWTIFGMGVVSFFIAIAGLLLLIIGIIPAIIWINASFAALYQNVLAEKEKQQEITIETSQ